ncbi:50S ribosomal protein L6 [Candidatus Woesearchaeota archaeon]|nr:50S ribosomal protein L6 [Candidatus Woesearchaeota archaeon]
MKQDIVKKIEVPEGVTVTVNERVIVKGPKGEIKKRMFHPFINIKQEGDEVILESKNATKREKKLVFTYEAHLKNMIRGVVEPWVYKMKICTGHFPMNVAMQGNKLVVKNFLGEKVPRVLNIKEGVKVNVQDKDVTVESVDKELAGNVASDIEFLLNIRGRDLRKFQDGIYIVSKAGKEVAK